MLMNSRDVIRSNRFGRAASLNDQRTVTDPADWSRLVAQRLLMPATGAGRSGQKNGVSGNLPPRYST
jgi:hypothetical protein